jgi:phage tail sheath protein FI
MCAFVAINKAPGVYIDEVQLPGPIAGVGTSTGAFVGPALSGDIAKPVRLANWTEFVEAFGAGADQPPYILQPPVYVTHAVRGFFSEGGSDCWFVRVATAQKAELRLQDANGNDTLVVRAKQEGIASNGIQIQVQAASIVAARPLTRADAPITAAANNTATLANAGDGAKFLPGDSLLVEDGANTETAEVASVEGTTINLTRPLQNQFGAGQVRIADLAQGDRRFRVDDAGGLEPGSNITLTQGGQPEPALVQSVDGAGVVTLAAGIANAYTMAAADPPVNVDTQEFTLVVGNETFANLSLDPRHSRFIGRAVDSDVADVEPVDPPNNSPPPQNLPQPVNAPLAGGADDDPAAALQDTNGFRDAIDALRSIDEVNILSVPDRTDLAVQAHMIAHCTEMQDRFAILDPIPRATSAQIREQRDGLPASDRGFAALYYPHIVVANPVGEGLVTIPPSGHLAGIYARVDNDRGVSKAPANEAFRTALDLERRLADEQQGPLNERGINVIRRFPGRGIRVWGARTISDNTNWRYINVRRLLLFIEESLQEGTQFVVFEPNDIALWQQVKRFVTEFLTRVWVDGGLVGATAEEAFRVRVDAELNPPATRALGILVIEVRVAPTTPAEFVVFRIIQQPGRPLVEE